MKNIRKVILGIAFAALFFWTGFQFGKKQLNLSVNQGLPKFSFIGKETPSNKNIDFSLFWDVWNRLDQYYVDKAKLDPQKMIYGAAAGLVASIGDPYTIFLNPQQNKATKEELSGQFEGVGMQLGLKDNLIVVIAPLKDTPAERAGIKAGDYILKVDNKDATGWTLPEAVAKIRGPKGSKIKITVLTNGGKPRDLTLTRETIQVKSVELQIELTQKLPENKTDSSEEKETKVPEIAYIKLSKFGDDTNKEWDQEVLQITDNFKQGKTKGLILDLRNNPGGYLSGAVYIASEFLKSGVVVKQESRTGGVQTYSVTRTGKLLEIPLVVLINRGSASASEIVSGALRDYKRATLVGEKSFGKGSVQEAQELPNGVGLHVTVAKWILPKGDWINGKGIEPDVKIVNDEKNPDKDLQLEKATEVLKKLIE